MLVGPTQSDTLYIWINKVRQSQTILATNQLAVDYSPTSPNVGQALVMYVRPSGSTTEVVEDSFLCIQPPGATGCTLYSAADGTYTISSPETGVYAVYAVKTDWTQSSTVYIEVSSDTTTSTTTSK